MFFYFTKLHVLYLKSLVPWCFNGFVRITHLCPHLVRRQTLKTPRAARASVCVCAVNETARLCHSLTEMQNMQDSYLNSVFAA